MERSALELARFDVDGGYLPGGAESADLAESLTPHPSDYEEHEDNPAPEDRLDASIFAAMLHP
jgi:hypothetical protein